MTILEAIILGIIQGLTEFLPVSSSGHLEIANYLFGIEGESNLHFTMMVHLATVLSTVTVFFKEIVRLLKGLFKFTLNDETVYLFNIMLSMVPIGFVGLFFKDKVEGLFTSNMLLVGAMLLVTAVLLFVSGSMKSRGRKITPSNAFIIGLAQAAAIFPGLSRSGTTIATGLMLGVERSEVSKFSFLMVLIPIMGMNLIDFADMDISSAVGIGTVPLIAGFLAAYAMGTLACRWMISIVNKGRLKWFALYCAVLGAVSICVYAF